GLEVRADDRRRGGRLAEDLHVALVIDEGDVPRPGLADGPRRADGDGAVADDASAHQSGKPVHRGGHGRLPFSPERNEVERYEVAGQAASRCGGIVMQPAGPFKSSRRTPLYRPPDAGKSTKMTIAPDGRPVDGQSRRYSKTSGRLSKRGVLSEMRPSRSIRIASKPARRGPRRSFSGSSPTHKTLFGGRPRLSQAAA